MSTEHGMSTVVRRQTLQSRVDEAVRCHNEPTEYLQRRTRNAHKYPENFAILTGLIDDELQKPSSEQADWLQKITTSYYAHYDAS